MIYTESEVFKKINDVIEVELSTEEIMKVVHFSYRNQKLLCVNNVSFETVELFSENDKELEVLKYWFNALRFNLKKTLKERTNEIALYCIRHGAKEIKGEIGFDFSDSLTIVFDNDVRAVISLEDDCIHNGIGYILEAHFQFPTQHFLAKGSITTFVERHGSISGSIIPLESHSKIEHNEVFNFFANIKTNIHGGSHCLFLMDYLNMLDEVAQFEATTDYSFAISSSMIHTIDSLIHMTGSIEKEALDVYYKHEQFPIVNENGFSKANTGIQLVPVLEGSTMNLCLFNYRIGFSEPIHSLRPDFRFDLNHYQKVKKSHLKKLQQVNHLLENINKKGPSFN